MRGIQTLHKYTTRTMESHWGNYLKAFEKPITKMPNSTSSYITTDPSLGVSGFLDLKPSQPSIQARYDAMSGSWAGVQPANLAVSQGLFLTDAMPIQQKPSPVTKNVR